MLSQLHDIGGLVRFQFLIPRTLNFPIACLSFDSTPKPYTGVENKLPHHPRPALVMRQIGVKLSGDAVKNWQLRPRHSGKVVMLVMQTHIIGQKIQRPVVRICFGYRNRRPFLECPRPLLENVVLGDKMACTGVQRASEKRAREKVCKGTCTNASDQKQIKEDLHSQIEDMQVGQGYPIDHHGANSIEQDLESAKERLPQHRVQENCLERGRKVGINAIYTEGFMMGEVIWL